MKKIVLAMGMGAVLFFSGCAGDTALINYKKYNAYSNVQAGNLKYEEIAPVYDCVSSFS